MLFVECCSSKSDEDDMMGSSASSELHNFSWSESDKDDMMLISSDEEEDIEMPNANPEFANTLQVDPSQNDQAPPRS